MTPGTRKDLGYFWIGAPGLPLHVVTGWLGNPPKIAMKHDLMTTDADFAKAVEPSPGDVQQALQNCMQQASVIARNVEQAKQENAGFSGVCEGLQVVAPLRVTPTGFEPVLQT
jgi:hypothetical protein